MVQIVESKTTSTVGSYWYYLTCDEGDTKPTGEFPADSGNTIANGSRLFENGTEIRYEYNDGSWTAVGQTGTTLEPITVEPRTEDYVISATTGYGDITVKGVTAAIDNNIIAGNIKSGVEILGVTGTYTGTDYIILTYEGTMPVILETVEGHLKNYKIYGNTGGVGTQTDDGYKIPITSQVNTWCSELATVTNPSAPEKRYIKFGVSRNIPQGLTISKTGLIYYKGQLSELTVDTSGAVEKAASSTASTGTYAANIEDAGEGITVVGYVVIDGVYYYSKVYHYTWDYVKEHEPIAFPDPTPVTTDIYIGDEPLGEDEYVDSLSGKIYRDIDGTITPTDPPAPLPQISTFDGSTTITYDGTPAPEKVEFEYRIKG